MVELKHIAAEANSAILITLKHIINTHIGATYI